MIYKFLWRNKYITVDAKSLKDMTEEFLGIAGFFQAMLDTGKIELAYGAEDDYATLITEDEAVAKEFGFEAEDELNLDENICEDCGGKIEAAPEIGN